MLKATIEAHLNGAQTNDWYLIESLDLMSSTWNPSTVSKRINSIKKKYLIDKLHIDP